MCGAVALMRLVALTGFPFPGLPNRLLSAKYLWYLRPRKAMSCDTAVYSHVNLLLLDHFSFERDRMACQNGRDYRPRSQ